MAHCSLGVFNQPISQSVSQSATHVDNLCVLAAEQVAEGRDDAAVDERGHLLLGAADAQVGDGPRGLFLRLELALGNKKE